jgi:hypothetical protein
MAQRARHTCGNKPVSESVTERPRGSRSGSAKVLIGANRPGSGENDGKCSDEFRQQLLRQAVQTFLRRERGRAQKPE